MIVPKKSARLRQLQRLSLILLMAAGIVFVLEGLEMTAYEEFVLQEVRKGRSIQGLYPATDEQARIDFASWRKDKGV